jgi:hypothetical protein
MAIDVAAVVNPHSQGTIKSRPESGPALAARMHSDPQDTTPQMTRLLVILTKSRLKVLSVTSIPPPFHARHAVARLVVRPAGIEPACTSFAAKALDPLWRGRSTSGPGGRIKQPTPRFQGECSSSLRHTRTKLELSNGGCPRYRTGLSGFSDQRFHLISLAALWMLVDTAGIEPTTSRVQTECRSKLSCVPISLFA